MRAFFAGAAAQSEPAGEAKTTVMARAATIGVEQTRHPRLLESMIIGTLKLPGLLGLIKSSGDPLVDVAGAYFPAWLAACWSGWRERGFCI